MSRLLFEKDYIVVIPTYRDVEIHSHMMQHLFIGEEKCTLALEKEAISGNFIFLDSGVPHGKIENSNLFLLIDTTSNLAKAIRTKYLQERGFYIATKGKAYKDIVQMSDDKIIAYVEEQLSDLGVRDDMPRQLDERVTELIRYIKGQNVSEVVVPELAKRIALSTSRLTHLFRTQTGISLKNYLLLQKLELAYHAVMQGKTITEAALIGGFSDSAHLAATCKKLTGISIRSVMKK